MRLFILTILTLVVLTSCDNSDSTNSSNDKNSGAKDISFNLNDYSKSTLDSETKYALAHMWNEEKLAYDIYLALYKLYPDTKQFYNIATKSEVKHISAVEDLVKRYDINITNLGDYTIDYSEAELRALKAGEFAVPKIQTLYDQLYAQGKISKIEALGVGCMVEVVDVDDLDEFIKLSSDANDLIATFEYLKKGSFNHYWAFDKGLKNSGVSDGCCSLGSSYCKTQDEYPKVN